MVNYNIKENLTDRKKYILTYRKVEPGLSRKKTEEFKAINRLEFAKKVNNQIMVNQVLSSSVTSSAIEFEQNFKGKIDDIKGALEEAINLANEAIIVSGSPFAMNGLKNVLNSTDSIIENVYDLLIEEGLKPAVDYANLQQIEENKNAKQKAENRKTELIQKYGSQNIKNANIEEVIM